MVLALELMIKEKGDAFKAYRGETNPLSNAFFVYVKNASSIRKTKVEICFIRLDPLLSGPN